MLTVDREYHEKFDNQPYVEAEVQDVNIMTLARVQLPESTHEEKKCAMKLVINASEEVEVHNDQTREKAAKGGKKKEGENPAVLR